jgi:hypothetical protein
MRLRVCAAVLIIIPQLGFAPPVEVPNLHSASETVLCRTIGFLGQRIGALPALLMVLGRTPNYPEQKYSAILVVMMFFGSYGPVSIARQLGDQHESLRCRNRRPHIVRQNQSPDAKLDCGSWDLYNYSGSCQLDLVKTIGSTSVLASASMT